MGSGCERTVVRHEQARPARPLSRAKPEQLFRSRPSRRRGSRRRRRPRSRAGSRTRHPRPALPTRSSLLPPRRSRRRALDLRRVVLEREDVTAEVPDAGGEPDRRVAARAADLEHLAVGLRRDEREEEAAGGRLDLAETRWARPERPRSRSEASSRSRRSRTARTRSSSISASQPYRWPRRARRVERSRSNWTPGGTSSPI